MLQRDPNQQDGWLVSLGSVVSRCWTVIILIFCCQKREESNVKLHLQERSQLCLQVKHRLSLLLLDRSICF